MATRIGGDSNRHFTKFSYSSLYHIKHILRSLRFRKTATTGDVSITDSRVEITSFQFEAPDIGRGQAAAGVGNMAFAGFAFACRERGFAQWTSYAPDPVRPSITAG